MPVRNTTYLTTKKFLSCNHYDQSTNREDLKRLHEPAAAAKDGITAIPQGEIQ